VGVGEHDDARHAVIVARRPVPSVRPGPGTIASVEPLDNPVWHALGGPHAGLATGDGRARRYPTDVCPFVGLPDEPDAAAWAALAELVAPDEEVALFRVGAVPIAPGWDVAFTGDGFQMVAPGRLAEPAVTGRPLTVDDAEEMVDLVARTRPGPFLPRTVVLGGYVGVHVDGRLVAMAGERMQADGHVEISAVCTDPAHRGKGLAAALTCQVARAIRDRGAVPILHVAGTNSNAIRVYERLGFVTRATVTVTGLRPPGALPVPGGWRPPP
jgi:ribosomal protein S18 acetylase RimI-like enzyme